MIDDRFCLYELSKDEQVTCESITQINKGKITVMPNHHIDEFGTFRGFRYECNPHVLASLIPISKNMYHGTTMVQCDVSEEVILRLMLNHKKNREMMSAFLQRVDGECIPATLNCMPMNMSETDVLLSLNSNVMSTRDSAVWTPEVPDRIGIYHAYVKGQHNIMRTHKLFFVCTGGLNAASDEFCNMLIDVGDKCTADDVMNGQESWWLKKACQRTRCCLIKQLADAFQIPVTHMQDIQSYSERWCAIPTTDTVDNDIGMLDHGNIAIYNGCVDTTKNMNGILCNMHPSEGVWLFRGNARGSCYGSMYGDHYNCGVFPVHAPIVRRPQSVLVQDSDKVVRLYESTERRPYLHIDENYFRVLESMQWNRDNGVEELMPIIVGMGAPV